MSGIRTTPKDWEEARKWLATALTAMYKAEGAAYAEGVHPLRQYMAMREGRVGSSDELRGPLLSDAEVGKFLCDVVDVVSDTAERLSSPATDETGYGFGIDWRASLLEDVEALAEKLRAMMRVAERVRRLEQVAGRTPEEAAAYMAKAAELRERYGLGPRDGEGPPSSGGSG